MNSAMNSAMNSQLNRRAFLKESAGLTLALAIDPLYVAAQATAAESAYAPTLWLTIATDGTITVVSPAAELGQGSFTTLPLILAEELDADWSKVRPVLPPAWDEKSYGNPNYAGNFQ